MGKNRIATHATQYATCSRARREQFYVFFFLFLRILLSCQILVFAIHRWLFQDFPMPSGAGRNPQMNRRDCGRGVPHHSRLVSLAPHCSHLLVQDWGVARPSPYLPEEEESTLLAGEGGHRA